MDTQKKKMFGAWAVIALIILIIIVLWHKTPVANRGTSTTPTPQTQTQGTATGGKTGGTTNISTSINGRSFRIASYDAVTVPAGENYTVTFSGGKITSKICNTYSGTYSAINNSIVTNKFLPTTKLGCDTPKGIMQLEGIFVNTMTQTAQYAFNGQTLVLTGTGHTIGLTAK